jgi:hypothetical protein
MFYRYESRAASHATLLAIDLISEQRSDGVLLRGQPATHFASLSPHLHGALLLYAALKDGAELASALDLLELPSVDSEIVALVEQQASARVPSWRELLPAEAPHPQRPAPGTAERRAER